MSSADVAGTYALASINGRPMPAPIDAEGDVMVYDTLALARDGTMTERQGAGPPSGAIADSGSYAGTWVLDTASTQLLITFVPAHGPPLTQRYTPGNGGASLAFTAAGTPGTANLIAGPWVYNRVR